MEEELAQTGVFFAHIVVERDEKINDQIRSNQTPRIFLSFIW